MAIKERASLSWRYPFKGASAAEGHSDQLNDPSMRATKSDLVINHADSSRQRGGRGTREWTRQFFFSDRSRFVRPDPRTKFGGLPRSYFKFVKAWFWNPRTHLGNFIREQFQSSPGFHREPSESTDRIGRRTRLRPITRSYKLIPRRMKGFRELRNYTAFRASNLPPSRNFAVCRTRGEQVRLDEHFACRQCAIR